MSFFTNFQDSSSLGWGLTGNATTTPATNFLGTTDNQPIVFRNNNTETFRIGTAGAFSLFSAPNALRIQPALNATLDLNPTGTGVTQISTSGTGAINIGVTGKSTVINGLVRLPDYGVFHVQRITTNQGSIASSVSTPILWNSSSTIGNAVGTLNTTTGAITLNRGGKFRIEGFISYQNSGATTRYLVTIVTVSGTILQVFPANCTGIGVGANNVSLNYFSFYIQTSGTAIFTTNITPSAGTAQINAMSNVAATASTTCMTITEIG